MVDRTGVIYAGRDRGHEPVQGAVRRRDDERTLADALDGRGRLRRALDGGHRQGRDGRRPWRATRSCSRWPTPTPRSRPRRRGPRGPTSSWRPGAATIPNQVNNVLGFPFIFRGALDVARDRDQRGDEARGLAGARRARQDGRARLGLQGLRRPDLPLRPRVPDPEALRLPRAALGRAGGGGGGDDAPAWRASRSRTWARTCGGSRRCSRARARS